MKDLYVAYYGANNDTETFQTFGEAEEWLEKKWEEDGCEGFSEESCGGYDYIAKITHRSKLTEIQNKEKDGYKWNEEAQGYFIDGNADKEEWISEHDIIGRIDLVEI